MRQEGRGSGFLLENPRRGGSPRKEGGGGGRVKQVQCGKLAFLQGNRAHFGHFEGFFGFLVMGSRKPCLCYKFQ